MKYNEVLKELDEIISSDFTMDDFKELSKIWQKINNIYGGEILAQRSDAKDRYDIVRSNVNEIVFNKLKEKLEFEDEVINKIVSFIASSIKVEDLCVLDGNVITKVKGYTDGEIKDNLYFVSDNNFMDVTSSEFNNSNNENFKFFLAQSLNNLIKPLIEQRVDNDEVLSLDEDKLKYNLPDLNIYINGTINDILSDNTGKKIHKLFVKYEDLIFYFDMKLRDGYIIISQNNYKLHVLSEMLNTKNKVKTKN